MGQKKKKTAKKSESSSGRVWVILLLLGVVGLGAYLFLQPSQVLVPSVVGQSRQEAVSLIESAGLRVEVKTEATEDEKVQPEEVLKQSPEAALSVSKGSLVTISIAEKPNLLALPDVVGKTRSEAEAILTRVGFQVVFSETRSQTVEIGKVISQAPASGASVLKRGDVVRLVVSGGRGEQQVPNLVELTPQIARDQLKEKGLELIVLEVAQPGFRSGDPVLILRQEPEVGKLLPVGSKVTVFIPIPEPNYVPPNNPETGPTAHAPKLEGLTIAQARQLAKSAGVELEFAENAQDTSVITFQDPPAGDPLPAKDKTVLVRTAISAVVPGLSGLSQSEAKAQILRADLTVGTIRKSYGPVTGEVLGQRPSAGIEVVGGSSVDLVIADPSMTPDTAKIPAPVPTPAFTPAPWVE